VVTHDFGVPQNDTPTQLQCPHGDGGVLMLKEGQRYLQRGVLKRILLKILTGNGPLPTAFRPPHLELQPG
jgi:hypothetical protein